MLDSAVPCFKGEEYFCDILYIGNLFSLINNFSFWWSIDKNITL